MTPDRTNKIAGITRDSTAGLTAPVRLVIKSTAPLAVRPTSWAGTFISLVAYELRMHWRNPAWLVGLVAAMLIAYSETGTGIFGWPTINKALNGFQEASSKAIVIVAFLITLNSVTRDFRQTRRELLFSRPIRPWLNLAAKWTAGAVFSSGLVLALLGCVHGRLLLSDASAAYEMTPFVLTIVLCTVPAILYTCGLASLLGVICRSLTVALALFLAYFGFALANAGQNWDVAVSMADFTMSLKPLRGGITLHELGGTMGDLSFSRHFMPLSPDLMTRALAYTLLSPVILAVAGIIMEKRRRTG